MQNWTIKNGTALVDREMKDEDIHVSEGVFDTSTPLGASELDASDCYVMPGIIDVHGDAFERIIEPRPGVFFDKQVALKEADRQMVANGITTAYHGLGVSWEPGVRRMEASCEFVDAWSAIRSQLACDTHLNLRWEIYAIDEVEQALKWLEEFPGSILSVNDHATPFIGLDADHPRIRRMSNRIGISPEESFELLSGLFARSEEVPGTIEAACSRAVANDTRIFAHDETSPEQRVENRKLGMSVSEFPMTKEAARNAVSNDEHVVLGAPNVVRGGSQNNALCATAAVREGLCTTLASDYYYPALLLAAFKLVDDGVLKLADAWSLISTSAAEVVGLEDRGLIKPGKRGDLVLVDKETRNVRAVFVAGRMVYQYAN